MTLQGHVFMLVLWSILAGFILARLAIGHVDGWMIASLVLVISVIVFRTAYIINKSLDDSR